MSTSQWELEDPEAEEQDPETELPAPARQHQRELEKQLKQAKQESEEKARKLQEYERRDAFEAALIASGVEDVTMDDLKDIPTDQISPTLLKTRSQEKEDARARAEENQAKQMGFDNVEDFRKAMAEIKAKQEENRKSLTDQASIATQGPGSPPVEKSGRERAWEEYRAAIKAGKSPDAARAEMVRVIREEALGMKPA